MEQIGDMRLWSLDEIIDEEIGKEGTPEREAFDARVEARLTADEEKASYHITMPRSLHNSVAYRASQLGTSVSSYISSVMLKELEYAH